ncbi:MAG: hypothetical protein WC621_02285 [Patescibacteria group bacterium]
MSERHYENDKPPKMEDGKFYNIDPLIEVNGKIFRKVQCEYRNPSNPDEYAVRGIPEGSDEMKSFVLGFTDDGVKITVTQE